MPFINTKTTLPLDVSKKETLSDGLAQIAKDCLGKSENWLMTGFEEKADIYFRKNWTAAAYIEVKLCGHADSVSYFPTPDWDGMGKTSDFHLSSITGQEFFLFIFSSRFMRK